MNNISDYFTDKQTRLHQILARLFTTSADYKLKEAMEYALLNGGKRLRPLLVYTVGEILGVTSENLDAPACAIELIHCYSLVHDDLPAMDNDDFRRGQPSCHKVFGEAMAILVGDALQTQAFQLLAQANSFAAEQRLNMIETLAKASGAEGMVGGQALEFSIKSKDKLLLEKIHRLKTGALILASVQLGAIAAQANKQLSEQLSQYGNYLGLAYQIQDDILDNDTDKNELSYVACVGLQDAEAYLQQLKEQAFAQIIDLPSSHLLQALTNLILK